MVNLSGVSIFFRIRGKKNFKSNHVLVVVVLESKGLFCRVTQRSSPKEYFFGEERMWLKSNAYTMVMLYLCFRSIGSCVSVSLPDTGGSFTIRVVGPDWG